MEPRPTRNVRWWGLSRAQTMLAFALAIAVGVAAALLLPRSGGSSSATEPAVWVFGFRTVRADPLLRHASVLAATGFGAVAGGAGRVYFYDPGTGRLGYLDARAHGVRDLPGAPPGSSNPDVATPVLGVHGSRLWLVPSPDRVVSYDVQRRRVVTSVALDPASPLRRTALVVDERGAIVVGESDAGIVVARLDEAGRVTRESLISDTGASSTISGVATSRSSLWIVMPGRAVRADPTTLAVRTSITLTPEDGSSGGAVATGSRCFVLRGRTAVVELTRSGAAQVVRRLQRSGAGTTTPAALAVDTHHLYALVPTGSTADDHRSELTGILLSSGALLRTVRLSSSLYAGGLATSSEGR